MVFGIILNRKVVSRQNKGDSNVFCYLGKKIFLYLSESASQRTYITKIIMMVNRKYGSIEYTNSLNTEFHSIKK